MPVSVLDRLDEAGLPSVALVSRLHDRGGEVLGEPWLRGVGVATKVTDGGTVLLVVLATGDTDRPALDKELHDAEPKATELVNQARAEASLPPVSLDAALVEAAKRWLAEASKRGCFVGFEDDPGCPGAPPEGGDWTRARQDTWRGPVAAYSWYLVPAIYGDELLKRFGAAATIAPDGMVWSTVVFAK